MIHQYKLGGYNIVLDVCSGAVHVVDDIAYDLIAGYESKTRGELISEIAEKILRHRMRKHDRCRDDFRYL